VTTPHIAGDLGGRVDAPVVARIQGTTVSAPPGDASAFLDSTGAWSASPGYYPGAQAPRVPRTVLTQFQAGHGFVLTSANSGASNLNDTTAGNFICGKQAATVVTVGDSASIANITKTGLAAIDTTGMYLLVRFRLSSALNPQTLHLDLGNDSAFANMWRWQFADIVSTLGAGFSYDGEWEQIILSFADATVTGSPTRSGVTALRLRARDTGTPLTVQWQEISLVPEPAQIFPNGVVSVCFDDGYQTQYDNARPVMDSYGFRATAFVIREGLGTSGNMTLAEVKSLQDDLNWEIGLHADTTAVHQASDVSSVLDTVETDLRHEKTYFQVNGLKGSDVFAYPAGLWNPSVTALLSRYTRAGRLNFFKTQETFPPAQPYKLRACGAISSASGGHTATQVNGFIDTAKASRSWLILIFHKIVTGAVTTTTECSLTDFTSIMSHLTASGMPVRTIGEVMRLAAAEAETTESAEAASYARLLTPTAVKTSADSPYSAKAGDFVPVDSTGGAVSISLPAVPPDLTVVAAKLVKGSSAVTITAGGADAFNDDATTARTLSLLNQAITMQYSSAAGVWYVLSDDLPLSQLDARYNPATTVYRQASSSVAAGNSAYGAAYTFSPDSGFAAVFPTAVSIAPSGIAAGETVTFRFTVTWSDNTTTVQGVNSTTGSNATVNVSASQLASILAGGDAKYAKTIAVAASSSLGSGTAAAGVVTIVGLNQR
jgi:hypothetical protein